MRDFVLDQRLREDTFELGSFEGQHLLLMNNSLVPWFILVPRTSKTEIFELAEAEQALLYKSIHRLSEHVQQHFPCSKINVAAIGNVVRQLHVHVIGRSEDDYCWPGVVWGRSERKAYGFGEVKAIAEGIVGDFGGDFVSMFKE